MARTYDINLVSLIQEFGSEDKCRDYLEHLRWPHGARCPRCQSAKISRIHDRKQFDCDGCRYQFSATSGTVFHDTKLPLWKWFLAVYMIVEAKKGVSAAQLGRTVDVQYRTAWHLSHSIRSALQTPTALLAGVVEIDETTVGGRQKREGDKTGYSNKTWIVGAVQRDGEIRLKAVADRKAKTLRQFIEQTIGPDAEKILTDEYAGYQWLGRRLMHIERDTIRHNQGQYADGATHTNNIEGAWSLFKRSIVGSFHKVSAKHLDLYLDEFEFRFNNRHNPYIFRDAMRLLALGEAMPYAELVA